LPKISELPAETTPESGDLIPIVDIAGAITKKITREDILVGAPLPDDTVTTDAIADGAVIGGKINVTQLTGNGSNPDFWRTVRAGTYFSTSDSVTGLPGAGTYKFITVDRPGTTNEITITIKRGGVGSSWTTPNYHAAITTSSTTMAWRKVPYAQGGTESITPSAANTPTSKVLTFPEPFSAAPNVTVTPNSAVPGTVVTGWAVTGISTTQCTLWVTRTNTTATILQWIAIDTD
jgi:hypothetical protein